MKTTMKNFFSFSLTFLIMAILLTGTKPAQAATTWYVTTAGNDTNSCTAPALPCATIQGALSKAASGDTIRVAAGTYTSTVTPVVSVEKAITLSGGWDSSFLTQMGMSTVDGEGARQPMYIWGDYPVLVEYFVFENSMDTVGIESFADLTLDHCLVQNNHGGSWGGGITNMNILTVRWSNIRGNFGHGIYSNQFTGPLVIENSTIADNEGSGIYFLTQNASFVNTTISGNHGTGEGGGIYFMGGSSHVLTLKNVTITNNDAIYSGGGIYNMDGYGGQIQMENTIVADNLAQNGPDCFGTNHSLGYNLVSDTAGCTFLSATGDLLDEDAKLGWLQDNGGPTQTHWLYANSPALEAGNPGGCTDASGSPLTIDQRGFPRPLDADEDGNILCDIGAFEADPEDLPPAIPQDIWYVTPLGSDANYCLSPATPCATMNGAIGKAIAGDSVYVSEGIFTASGASEVVLIDKDLVLSGGWNLAFTNQSGFTEIDGGNKRRGVTIQDELVVSVDGLYIYNGLTPADSVYTGGGGMYIGGYSKVTLTDMIFFDNYAGNGIDPSGTNGGAIYAAGSGKLVLNNSLLLENYAFQDGGGIYNYHKPTILNNCSVVYNLARSDGSGIGGEGDLTLNDSEVSYNGSAASDRGGGIFNQGGNVIVNRSTIRDNITGGEGGGIWANYVLLDQSALIGNEGGRGGGMYLVVGEISLKDSLLMGNRASGDGGGILNADHVYLVNSSVLNNYAANNGGGVYGGQVIASNATIAGNTAGNTGGGLCNGGGTFRNTILAGNHAATNPDCSGYITSASYDLFGDTTGCTITPGTGDLTNVNPNFSYLYGYPSVLTLGNPSQAIDGGNPAGCVDHLDNPITTDQIGTTRPVDGTGDGSAICDIGAYEYDPSHLPQWLFLPMVGR